MFTWPTVSTKVPTNPKGDDGSRATRYSLLFTLQAKLFIPGTQSHGSITWTTQTSELFHMTFFPASCRCPRLLMAVTRQSYWLDGTRSPPNRVHTMNRDFRFMCESSDLYRPTLHSLALHLLSSPPLSSSSSSSFLLLFPVTELTSVDPSPQYRSWFSLWRWLNALCVCVCVCMYV